MTAQLPPQKQMTGMLGHPVAENPIDRMFDAVYAHYGLHWQFWKCDVAAEDLGAAIAGTRALGFRGYGITVPYKIAAIPFLDAIDDDAKAIGAANLGGFFVSAPVGEASASLDNFNKAYKAAGENIDAVFATTSYDAAFLAALAIEKAGGDKAKLAESLRAVASAPGEPILAGEWAKAKKLIAEGKDIDYKGAGGDHEFDAAGDVPGNYAFFKVSGTGYESIADMK